MKIQIIYIFADSCQDAIFFFLFGCTYTVYVQWIHNRLALNCPITIFKIRKQKPRADTCVGTQIFEDSPHGRTATKKSRQSMVPRLPANVCRDKLKNCDGVLGDIM